MIWSTELSRFSRLGLRAGLLAASCSTLASAAAAQDAPRFTIDASTRIRVEALDGQFRPGTPKDDFLISSRTDIAAKVEAGPLVIGGEMVDARGYGERSHTSVRTSEINALEPVQAYVALQTKSLLSKGDTASLTGGRYSLDIGSSRLVGRTDFPNGVQSYLGGLAEWRTKGKDRVVAFWSHPFSALPDTLDGILDNKVQLDRAGGNLTFFGASGTAANAYDKISLEAYGYRLAEQDRGGRLTRNRHLVTAGSRVRRAPAKGKFDFEGEGALQWGKARNTTAVSDVRDLDVHAGFTHLEAGWTAPSGWTPRIAVLFDYASGDSAKADSYGRFDTLFGARRADFGPLSLFGPVGRANLISPAVRVEAKSSKRFDMMATVRPLWLANATDSFASTGIRDRTGASGSHAGTQVDLRARRWLVQDRVRLEAGAAYLGKGRFLKEAPNAPATGDTHYGYIDLSASF
jgi:hypothetical protein